MKILIGAHYNLNNGDRALLEATIQMINSLFDNCEITVSAYEPNKLNDTRFQTVSWPLKNGIYEKWMFRASRFRVFRFLFNKFYKLLSDSRYVRSVEEADVVLISGGHHLTDILGSVSYYRLASNFIVPINLKKKVVLLPQSIGPASSNTIRKSIEKILRSVHSVAYRDESSRLFLESIKCNSTKIYVPDLVYSLNIEDGKEKVSKTVGVALYHAYTGERREKILPFTISNLTKTLDYIMNKGYIVKILPMDQDDDVIAMNIYNNLSHPDKTEKFIIGKQGNNILDLVNQFRCLSFVLAYKTHSTIFSMICRTPLVSIAYHPKSVEFMETVGLKEYAINDKDASYDNLCSIIEKLEVNIDWVKEQEIEGVTKNRKLIEKYIQEMLKDEFD